MKRLHDVQVSILRWILLFGLCACQAASVQPAHEPTRDQQEGARRAQQQPVRPSSEESGAEMQSFRLFGRVYRIDRFERSRMPERTRAARGHLPMRDLDFQDAREVCRSAEARLCMAREWVLGCLQAARKKEDCDTKEGYWPSGMFCQHDEAQDFSNNLKEWALTPSGNPVLMGGSDASNCSDFRFASPDYRSQQVGVRCCL